VANKYAINAAADEEMRMRLELLVECFNGFRAEYGMQLHVKDFFCCMRSHPLLAEFTESYLYHESSFCSYVKGNPSVNEQCIITSNELLRRRLIERQHAFTRSAGLGQYRSRGFYGVCWCGIREYVHPIVHSGIVIGALLVGSYRAEDAKRERAFRRLSERYGMNIGRLRETYAQSTGNLPASPESMEGKVALYASYLSMLAEYYVDYSMITGFDESMGKHTQRHKIISLATDYITKNLSKKISVADMAVFCMCSKSTLNHMFPSVMGRTIPEYVSIQRINRAKYLLLNTNLSVEQISVQCGFASSAYFSVVFKKVTDMTPTEYRSRAVGNRSEDITGIL